ncbi:hypothetical protein OROMI_012825 [Orobanche minor]
MNDSVAHGSRGSPVELVSMRSGRQSVCGIKAEMVDGTEQDSYRCFGEPNRENLTKEEDKLIFTFSEEGELQEHGGTARSLE